MFIHSVIERSKVNGPGVRYTIWFQGCSIQCKGCANKELWKFRQGKEITPEALYKKVYYQEDIDGISVTGGEPLDQYKDLIRFLELCKQHDIEVFLTSGYTLDEIKKHYPKVLGLVDILVSGPYIEEKIDKTPAWRGSTNQEIHLLSPQAQTYKDYKPEFTSEFIFSPDGTMTATGFTMPDFVDKERKNQMEQKIWNIE